MEGGRRPTAAIAQGLSNLRADSAAYKSRSQTAELQMRRAVSALQQARNVRPKPNNAPVHVPQSVIKTERDIALAQKQQAVNEQASKRTARAVKAPTTENPDLKGIVVPVIRPVVSDPNIAAQILSLRMRTLQREATALQIRAVSDMAASVELRRTNAAIAVINRQMEIAQLAQIKSELLKNLASNTVIGGIVQKSIGDLNTSRSNNSGEAQQFALANPVDPSINQGVMGQQVQAGMSDLVSVILLSKGNVRDLIGSLDTVRADLAISLTNLGTLMNEGANLTALRDAKQSILDGALRNMSDLDGQIGELNAALKALSMRTTFSEGGTLADYIALKKSIDTTVNGLKNDITTLIDFVSSINLGAKLDALNAAKARKATTQGSYRDALMGALQGVGGARQTLSATTNQYGSASSSLAGARQNLLNLQNGSMGPTMANLTGQRGNKPVEPSLSAPAVITILAPLPSKLKMTLDTGLTPLKLQIDQVKAELTAALQKRDAAHNNLNKPGGLYDQRNRIKDIISELTRLKANTSDLKYKGLYTTLTSLLTRMGNTPSPDATPLNNAKAALSKLRSDIAASEAARIAAVKQVESLTMELQVSSAQLLKAQSALNLQTIGDQRGSLKMTAPAKADASNFTSVILKLGNAVKEREALNDDQVIVAAALRAEEANATLLGPMEGARFLSEAARLRTEADLATEAGIRQEITVTTTDLTTGSELLPVISDTMDASDVALKEALSDLTNANNALNSLRDTIMPMVIEAKGVASSFGDKTFQYITTRRLFKESFSTIMRSTADITMYYAGKSLETLKVAEASIADAIANAKTAAEGSVATIKEASSGTATLAARIQSLQGDLARYGILDTSTIDIVAKLTAIQNKAATDMIDASNAMRDVADAATDSAADLSTAKDDLLTALTKLQDSIDTMAALNDLKNNLTGALSDMSTGTAEIARLRALAESQTTDMAAANSAKETAKEAANGDARERIAFEESLARLREIKEAENTADQSAEASTAELLRLYYDLKGDPTLSNITETLEGFFKNMGDTFQTMASAKDDLKRKLAELQDAKDALQTFKDRVTELQNLLNGAENLDRGILLRNADILKLIGERDANAKRQKDAEDAKLAAAEAAAKDANKADAEQKVETVITLTGDAARMIKLVNEIKSLKAELAAVDRVKLLDAELKDLESKI